MLDRSVIGREFPTVSVTVELDAVRRFARAIGETSPVFFDDAVARAQGYRGVPIPPTYVFCLKHAVSSPDGVLRSLGVEGESGKLLHAEQSFEYVTPICAGDRLSFHERVADVYEKKGGALVFIILETLVNDADERRVAVIRHTEVVRTDV
jgi:acyl dehydratase